VNRWFASALGVLVVGLLIAFLLVPYDDGSCPTGAYFTIGPACHAYGSVPRITAVAVTVFVSLVLAAVGSAATSRRT
jgi:hypothetical protein